MSNSYTLHDEQPVRIRNHAGEYPETLSAQEFAALRVALRARLNSDDLHAFEEEYLETTLEKLNKFEIP